MSNAYITRLVALAVEYHWLFIGITDFLEDGRLSSIGSA